MLATLDGSMWLIVALLYGAGLRLLECLGLRVKDVDFNRSQIVVRQGKGRKDRAVPLPALVVTPLRRHLAAVRQRHEGDRSRGEGAVHLPDAFGRKSPGSATGWQWQYVFPAGRVCRDPRWGAPGRYHLHESAVQRAVVEAVRKAGISKRATCHTLVRSLSRPTLLPIGRLKSLRDSQMDRAILDFTSADRLRVSQCSGHPCYRGAC